MNQSNKQNKHSIITQKNKNQIKIRHFRRKFSLTILCNEYRSPREFKSRKVRHFIKQSYLHNIKICINMSGLLMKCRVVRDEDGSLVVTKHRHRIQN